MLLKLRIKINHD